MNNAEYLRLMKKQREIAKMQEAEIREALQLDPEPEHVPDPEPEEMTEEVKSDDTENTEPDGEVGAEGSDQGLEG